MRYIGISARLLSAKPDEISFSADVSLITMVIMIIGSGRFNCSHRTSKQVFEEVLKYIFPRKTPVLVFF